MGWYEDLVKRMKDFNREPEVDDIQDRLRKSKIVAQSTPKTVSKVQCADGVWRAEGSCPLPTYQEEVIPVSTGVRCFSGTYRNNKAECDTYDRGLWTGGDIQETEYTDFEIDDSLSGQRQVYCPDGVWRSEGTCPAPVYQDKVVSDIVSFECDNRLHVSTEAECDKYGGLYTGGPTSEYTEFGDYTHNEVAPTVYDFQPTYTPEVSGVKCSTGTYYNNEDECDKYAGGLWVNPVDDSDINDSGSNIFSSGW
jgi:hypothetical protein